MTTLPTFTRRSVLRGGASALIAASAGALFGGALLPAGAAAPLASGGSVRIVWSSTPHALQPGSPATLSYRLIDTTSGQAITTLPLVHEKPMHLILVRRDLTHFQHIHPQLAGDGTWRVRTTFPLAGTYVLYDEFSHGGQTVVDRRAVTVGQPSPAAVLAPDLTPTVQNGVRIALAAPAQIKAGQAVRLTYRLTRAGRPVTDLTPYLGAAAHVAIISQDTQSFAHTHGEVPGSTGGMDMGGMDMGTPPAHFGPEITVTHTFARAGLYKIWAQFGYHGHVLIASVVVRVQ